MRTNTHTHTHRRVHIECDSECFETLKCTHFCGFYTTWLYILGCHLLGTRYAQLVVGVEEFQCIILKERKIIIIHSRRFLVFHSLFFLLVSLSLIGILELACGCCCCCFVMYLYTPYSEYAVCEKYTRTEKHFFFVFVWS